MKTVEECILENQTTEYEVRIIMLEKMKEIIVRYQLGKALKMKLL